MVVLEKGSVSKGFKILGEYETEELMRESIRLLLELEPKEVFYTRSWLYEDGYTYIDYGKHSDFFRYKTK
jgi:hypothetical protein